MNGWVIVGLLVFGVIAEMVWMLCGVAGAYIFGRNEGRTEGYAEARADLDRPENVPAQSQARLDVSTSLNRLQKRRQELVGVVQEKEKVTGEFTTLNQMTDAQAELFSINIAKSMTVHSIAASEVRKLVRFTAGRLSSLLRRDYKPDSDDLERFARVFGCEPTELISRELTDEELAVR